MSQDTILLLAGITLMYSTPMVFAAQGSVISEVSGVVNIGIEGMMTIGAFTGAAIGYFSGNPWLGFICAGIAGALFGLIHAFASVTCKADQTVCGIAMNLAWPSSCRVSSLTVRHRPTRSPTRFPSSSAAGDFPAASITSMWT